VNRRLHLQFRHCIVVMLNRKSCLFGLGARTRTSARSSLVQFLLDEENLETAGKQEEEPELFFAIGARQWVADRTQGDEQFDSVEGDVYPGDDEQHGECVEEWPDSIFVPGPFQREDWPDSIFLPGHFQRQETVRNHSRVE